MMKKSGNNDVAPTLTTKPKTVVLAKKKRKTAISVDAQEGGGSKRMPIHKGVSEDFEALVGKIQSATHALRQDACGVVNRSVTARAWLTGYYIVEYEQGGKARAEYGDGLLKRLAKRLSESDFSVSSLKDYRSFYLIYPELSQEIAGYLMARFGQGQSLPKLFSIDVYALEAKSHTVCGLLPEKDNQCVAFSHNEGLLRENGDSVRISPWALFNRISYSHVRELFRCPEDLMRTFYAFEAIRGTWSVRELKRQIDSQYYQRCGWSKDPHKYAAMVQGKVEKLNADDFIKTNTVLEFLGAKLPPDWKEKDLEQGICDGLKDFILEMGTGFCFEARQKKILIDDEYEWIDLVFYHRILKCHVLIELKPKKFDRADALQLGVYMEYYRKRMMSEGDNPPIGILMCTEVGKELAEYIAPFIDERMFLTKYMLQLPSKETLTGFLKKENEGLPASEGE